MNDYLRTVAGSALATCLISSTWAAQGPPSGTWRFSDDDSLVSFAACGSNLCATLIGGPTKGKDAGNKKGCGKVLIGDLQPIGTDRYKGWTLDPDTDKRYSATLQIEQPDGIKLTVSALGGLVNESFSLARAAEARGNCTSS